MREGRSGTVTDAAWVTLWQYGTDGTFIGGCVVTNEASGEMHLRYSPVMGDAVEAYTTSPLRGAIAIPASTRRIIPFDQPGRITRVEVRAASGVSGTVLFERLLPSA